MNLGQPEIDTSTKTTLATMMMATVNAEKELPIDLSPPSYRRAIQSDI